MARPTPPPTTATRSPEPSVGQPSRSGDVLDFVTFVELREALGRPFHDHEDELDPTLLRVPVGKGERDALARLVDAHHEELGMGMLGHPGCVDAELEDLLRELRLLQVFERQPLSLIRGREAAVHAFSA